MSSHIIKCCVKECTATGVRKHRFPNPDTDWNRFNNWLDILQINELRDMEPISVFKNRRICSAHFDGKFMSPGNPRLHKNAIPNRNMIDTGASTSSSNADHTYSKPENQIDPNVIIENSAHVNVLEPISSTDTVSQVTPKRKRDSTNRDSLLRSISVTRQTDLSPKARKLYRTALRYKKTALNTKRSLRSFRKRLDSAQSFADSKICSKMSVLTGAAQDFLHMQLREVSKKKQARRFTRNEKILSLSLLKQSPKQYNVLQHMFILPSKKTLNNFLSQMSLRPGINTHVFGALKKSVNKLSDMDRHCALMFDEISLASNLQYNQKEDCIDGFADNGSIRTQEFANHALVFMVRGLVKQWKQPIAFIFNAGGTNGTALKSIIKDVIRNVQNTGLKVVCTVCDQAKPNESAINLLNKETIEEYARRGIEYNKEYFEIDGSTIIPLFDVPHLIKGLRNNFFKRNIKCVIDNTVLTAKWKDIIDFYEFDNKAESGNLRTCPRLSDCHIYLEKSSYKMKVKYCTQVFSQRVASSMNYCAKHNDIDKDGSQTARVLLFFDELFDSLNSSTKMGVQGKPLTGALTENSCHWAFWKKALNILHSMKFEDKIDPKDTTHPPSLKNFIRTIRGVMDVFHVMKKRNKEFNFLMLRSLNQDPLENFFSLIRSHGGRNINPSCNMFIASFKTLLINNFMGKHSIGSNCEEDRSDGALSNLHELLSVSVDEAPFDGSYMEENINLEITLPNINESNTETQKSNYCAGFIIKKVKKITKKCQSCLSSLLAYQTGPQHELIRYREYEKKLQLLMYPSFSATNAFVAIKKITLDFLNKNIHSRKIVHVLINYLSENVDLNLLSCDEHKELLRKVFIKETVKLILFHFINEINKILVGKRKGQLTSVLEKKAEKRHLLYCNYKNVKNKTNNK